jgi:hypothetical protein
MPRTIATLSATALLAAGCGGVASRGAAAPDTCVVTGSRLTPAEIRIYDAYPYGSPGGKRQYIGPLNQGERHRIATRYGRIWYAYRWHDDDVWRDGEEVPCRDGQLVELPRESDASLLAPGSS